MPLQFPNFSFSNSKHTLELHNFLTSAGLTCEEIKRVHANYWMLNKYYKDCPIVNHFFESDKIYGEKTIASLKNLNSVRCHRITRFTCLLFSSVKPTDEGSAKLFNLRKGLVSAAFSDRNAHFNLVKGLRFFSRRLSLFGAAMDIRNGDDDWYYLNQAAERSKIRQFWNGMYASTISSMIVMIFKNGMKLRYNCVLSSRQCILLSLSLLQVLIDNMGWNNLIKVLSSTDKDQYKTLVRLYLGRTGSLPLFMETLAEGGDLDEDKF